MNSKKKKDALTEMQCLLNSLVVADNLLNPEILDISTKLDNLIVEYYLNNSQEKGITK